MDRKEIRNSYSYKSCRLIPTLGRRRPIRVDVYQNDMAVGDTVAIGAIYIGIPSTTVGPDATGINRCDR